MAAGMGNLRVSAAPSLFRQPVLETVLLLTSRAAILQPTSQQL